MLSELINKGLIWSGDTKKEDFISGALKKGGCHEFICELPPLCVFSFLSAQYDSYVFWVDIYPTPQFLLKNQNYKNHHFVKRSDLKKLFKRKACIITSNLSSYDFLNEEAILFAHNTSPKLKALTRWKVSSVPYDNEPKFKLTPLKGFYDELLIPSLPVSKHREAIAA
jgi:hypothetical protein